MDAALSGQPTAFGRNAALAALWCGALLTFHGCRERDPFRESRIAANDNRQRAGTLRDGALTVSLEVRRGEWFPDADSGQHAAVYALAEAGHRASIPGPLIRVTAGTRVRVHLRNTLSVATTWHGFGDTLTVPSEGERDVMFTSQKAGNYYYWGSTTDAPLDERSAVESQLQGAIIVDPAGTGEPVRDRVFMLGVWHAPPDSTGPKPWFDRDVMVINGKQWPYTERFDFTTGDTVRWRWLNPTGDGHPMHLHGFYFTVMSRGTESVDTVYDAPDRRQAVTELMLPGSTMSLQFVPTTAGQWLFHCHFAYHVSHYLGFVAVPDPADPGGPDSSTHGAHAMHGLILGVRVHDRAGATVPSVAAAPARQIRLLAERAPRTSGPPEAYGFIIDSGSTRGANDPALKVPAVNVPALKTPVPDVPVLSPTLELARNQPVAITVVNHLRQPTAVHWHGMELQDSYADGVPGWSGTLNHIAPSIAVGDSFVARFTPVRSGTFIYHSHTNEGFQISSGLYGALIVRDAGATPDTAHERLFVIGGNGGDQHHGRVNGELTPGPMTLTVGTTYRLRIVQINPDFRVYVSLMSDTTVQQWRPLAKDGAELPSHQQTMQLASIGMGPGETVDVEITPTAGVPLTLDVTTQNQGWSVRVTLTGNRHPKARTTP